ncbi:hypothetical protein BC938DRAFT_476597 [Jimgerdemannia flammicorona]|uniref:Uncharacterized protein n=1 Tax=Jimgerdemannia flammicorona TaxID=994334 RepID=A0A433QQD7_9FUNG|nr:hypothetical protein BC938DRAFT_476597 [Jimgerdemannia flammicorona]
MSIIASVSTSGVGTPFNVSPSTSSPNSSSSNNRNSVIPSNSHRASTIALEKFSRSVDHLADVLNSSDDDDALLAQRASESGVSSVTNTTVTSSSNTSSNVSSQRSRSLDSNPEPFASSSTDARGSGGQLRHSTSRSSVRSKSSVKSQGRRNREIRAQYEYYNLNPKDVPDVSAEMEKWYAMTDSSEEREVSRAQKWTRMAEKIHKGGEEVYQFKYSPKVSTGG